MKLRYILPGCYLLLTGCQQQPSAPVNSDAQVQQLSALVASAGWLRDNCANTTIPDDARLIDAAREQGKMKGWNSHNITPQAIRNASIQRYAAISADTQSPNEKCAALNASAAPFLATLK